jgi:hypothetical protein
VDDPILLPDCGRDIVGEVGSLESMKEFGPEDPVEGFDWKQEMMAGRESGAMIGGQSTGGDEIVTVRMVGQVTSPGAQDTDQGELSADKTRILGQMLCCSCQSPKEQVIDERLVTAGEWARGSRDGEGEHEVRDGQQKCLLFLQPFLGFVVLTFRAVTVAAGVVAVLGLVALRAGVGLATQSWGAALLNTCTCAAMQVWRTCPACGGEQAVSNLFSIGRAVLAEDVCQF